MGSVKVKLFTQKEINNRKRLNEAENLANIATEIEQINNQINNIRTECQKRIDPLMKKLNDLQRQQSILSAQSGAAAQNTVNGQQQNANNPVNGTAASPGATQATQPVK